MDYGLVLFTSDRGISPAAAAKLADDHGFRTFYVPEHTHITVKRAAGHPKTGDASPPGAGGRGGKREKLKVDRPQRRRLDHHPARLRHRRAGAALAGHLGRGRP